MFSLDEPVHDREAVPDASDWPEKVDGVAIPRLDPVLLACMNEARLPMWCKLMAGPAGPLIMLAVNPVYCSDEWYGPEMAEYPFKTDADMWPQEVADKFWALDLQAYLSPRTWCRSVEPTPSRRTGFCRASKISIPIDRRRALHLGYCRDYP